MDLTVILVATVPSIISGLVLFYVKKMQEKNERREEEERKRQEERERDIQRREKLSLDFMSATASVTKEAVACILSRKPPNGELEEAFDYMQEVKHELEDYEREKASR